MDQPAQTRHFALEELLPREPVQLDQEKIRECVQNQVILVTGAAGSIGAELCRQIARFKPSALVAFDVSFALSAGGTPLIPSDPGQWQIRNTDPAKIPVPRY